MGYLYCIELCDLQTQKSLEVERYYAILQMGIPAREKDPTPLSEGVCSALALLLLYDSSPVSNPHTLESGNKKEQASGDYLPLSLSGQSLRTLRRHWDRHREVTRCLLNPFLHIFCFSMLHLFLIAHLSENLLKF